MNETNEMTESDRVINRHIARILTELEEAGCPVVFRNSVKSNLSWLRTDLKEMESNNDRARTRSNG